MMAYVGASLATPVVAITSTEPGDVADVVANVRVANNPLNIVQRSATRLCFLEAIKATQPPVPVPPAPAAAQPPPPTTATQPVSVRRLVRHSLVLQQTDESTSELITDDVHIAMLRKYEAHFGEWQRPPPDEEPTSDQL